MKVVSKKVVSKAVDIGGELIKINSYVGNSEFLKFRAGRYFFNVWESFIFQTSFKKNPISILIANNDTNTTP